MNDSIKARIAFALKCDVSDVPDDEKELAGKLKKRRDELKAKKAVKHGQSVH